MPLSLGIEMAGRMIMKSNETITAFTDDPQPGVLSQMRKSNKLDKFELMCIPSAPHVMPHGEVTFDLDSNGELPVWAKDKQSQSHCGKITVY